ncbi:MAG TPA: peptidylprolyl isomerase [Thermoanaerobaculia bacterium]|nr:peptidylprolyl isomerase [Thermoanaerobaculia bacterium]
MSSRGSGRVSFLSVAALSAFLAVSPGCSSRTVPPPSPRPAAPPVEPAAPPPPVATPNPLEMPEAEATLLELEDRRAFDEAALRSLCAGPEPTRARAALALGRIGDERGAALLRPLLRDQAPAVRSAAVFAAGLLTEAGMTADLVPLLADPDPRVAIAAARAVGFLARPEGEQALTAALPGAPSPEIRAALLEALWRFSNPASEAALLPFAGDRDPKVRGSAIYALARKPQAGSLAALTAALGDENPDAAAFAARALGVLGSAESAGPLAAALDGRTPLVIQSLVALEGVFEKVPAAHISDERRQRVLTLAGDANTNVAVPALVLLRQFAAADREIARRLWSIALSGEGRRRQVALQSVVAAFRAGALSALDSAAASTDPFLRAAAADALSFLATPDARPYRDRFASDREVVVRLANLDSLRTADAVRENRPTVNSALTDRDAGVRAAAVEALSKLDDAAILPLYEEAVEKSKTEPAPDVAIAVIGACEKRKSDPAAAALVESIARGTRPLPARLARRALVTTFGRPAGAYPAPEYVTGKTHADYLAILAEARRPWRAAVETAAGVFTFRLAGQDAPLTVMNFVTLARARYFDGVRIHRVVPNFVLQDGDPTATGNGGPGYEIRDELNALEYRRGTVGMALSGPDTGGSQWFVTHSPQPHLNSLYTIFGQIAEGQPVVERIGQGERILRVTVLEGR